VARKESEIIKKYDTKKVTFDFRNIMRKRLEWVKVLRGQDISAVFPL
jgi:hypothetical protein